MKLYNSVTEALKIIDGIRDPDFMRYVHLMEWECGGVVWTLPSRSLSPTSGNHAGFRSLQNED